MQRGKKARKVTGKLEKILCPSGLMLAPALVIYNQV